MFLVGFVHKFDFLFNIFLASTWFPDTDETKGPEVLLGEFLN